VYCAGSTCVCVCVCVCLCIIQNPNRIIFIAAPVIFFIATPVTGLTTNALLV
jgi:hypothetical protein